ncbi:MAG: NADP-dependent malic enzyme, partial [Alphaproteobacteria bacterium]|nr:NADP-dependent malic enzyme [Alphaproteobacteria bacterium]NDC55961.1 NADP-dependent malic enzyme [Alphaproteobacteria bacterium]
MNDHRKTITDDEALHMHASGRPGKLEIRATKPLTTQRDLSLAYSPGVAVPCLRIHANPAAAYDYTAKGNMVAVISNGTAVLGLGDLGALASKPVMEGKAVLFKRFADVDSIDLEVDTRDVNEFINCVRFLGPSFGGINLEDIKAPDCFIIEQRLRELLDIPVFHDDQHGTAIIAGAGLINALDVTGRKLKDISMVVNGAGASAIACVELFKALGVPHANIIMCDTKGVIYQGRTEGMNQWKSAHAVPTKHRTLEQAMKGADIFVGLSAKGAMTPEMVKGMAKKPIIFAMANPDPEITPEEAQHVRSDAIVATGRSDYANQINNVLGFPYIFRGALDVRASTINDAMKIAASRALAMLAREDVPDEVSTAYGGRKLRYGPEYLIPVPFDPRLIVEVPAAVAEAAMKSGVARKPVIIEEYKKELRGRLDPTADHLQLIFERARNNPRRLVFAEGEEERAIRAALQFKRSGYGVPMLVGQLDAIRKECAALQIDPGEFDIHDTLTSRYTEQFTQKLYQQHQRQGHLQRDCLRMVRHNRNIFSALLVASGMADGMITGLTRGFMTCYNDIGEVIAPTKNSSAIGISLIMANGRTVFMSDTAVNELPDSDTLADIAVRTAAWVKRLGHTPRVALLSYVNFGQPSREYPDVVTRTLETLSARKVDFEFDGEMTADIALDYDLMKKLYPFCRLSGPANVLVMPGLRSATIAAKLLQQLGGGSVIGPVLDGLSHSVQIVPMGAKVSDVLTSAVFAAQAV